MLPEYDPRDIDELQDWSDGQLEKRRAELEVAYKRVSDLSDEISYEIDDIMSIQRLRQLATTDSKGIEQ